MLLPLRSWSLEFYLFMKGIEVSKYFVSSGFAFIHANSLSDIVAVEAIPVDRIDPNLVQKGLASSPRGLARPPQIWRRLKHKLAPMFTVLWTLQSQGSTWWGNKIFPSFLLLFSKRLRTVASVNGKSFRLCSGLLIRYPLKSFELFFFFWILAFVNLNRLSSILEYCLISESILEYCLISELDCWLLEYRTIYIGDHSVTGAPPSPWRHCNEVHQNTGPTYGIGACLPNNSTWFPFSTVDTVSQKIHKTTRCAYSF